MRHFNYKQEECRCLECDCIINDSVIEYSNKKYGIPLCINHQRWIENMSQITTFYTIRLYFALKNFGIYSELEKFDGFKHIDIAIPQVKLNIEVDGAHHNLNTQQAMADLKRTCHSLAKDYITIRIPNSITKYDNTLDETAFYLSEIIKYRLSKFYY